MKKSHWLFCLLSFLVLSLLVSPTVRAEEGSFSVTPLDPETGEAQSSYYDLLVEPKQKMQLQVEIVNGSSEEKTIQVEANNATTNDNGISSYLKEEERDDSLKVAFEDFAQVKEEQVTVPANGTAKAVIDLTIPEETFPGEILGGLRFTEVKSEEEKEEQKAAITNNIAYTIGVLLRESEEKVAPEMAMNGVVTEQRNYRNYISANLQNKAPCMIKELTAHAQVFEQETGELRYEASNDAMRMAPNSNFNFGISLEDQKFVPGDYTMKVTGTADGSPFEFSKDFTISAEEAKEYNKNAVFAQEDEAIAPWVYSLGIIGLMAIGLLLFLLIKKRREANEG